MNTAQETHPGQRVIHTPTGNTGEVVATTPTGLVSVAFDRPMPKQTNGWSDDLFPNGGTKVKNLFLVVPKHLDEFAGEFVG